MILHASVLCVFTLVRDVFAKQGLCFGAHTISHASVLCVFALVRAVYTSCFFFLFLRLQVCGFVSACLHKVCVCVLTLMKEEGEGV
jgi:hypothetical protein